jgi:glutaredoxin 3
MAQVIIYTKDSCPYCHLAKELLTHRNISFTEIRVDLDPHKLEEMMTRSQRRTVPQIFINNKSIGGYDDLAAISKSGILDNLLKEST